MTLFERVFGGNDAVYGLTEAAINSAIAQYGEDHAVSFPGTAYSLPCYYGVTGVKVETLGQLKEALGVVKTLMTREERLRSEDMGNYFRVAADSRDLNYDKFFVQGRVVTQAEESYTSHNTNRLDVAGTVKKLLTTDYVREELAGIRHN